jgi:hypothetical protein
MATIKLFESWLQSQLNEDWDAPGYDYNAVATAELDAFRSSAAGGPFRKFTELVVKSGLETLESGSAQEAILFALGKRGQATTKGFLGIGKVSDDKVVKKTLEALANKEVNLSFFQNTVDYVPGTSTNYVRTEGKVTNNYSIDTSPRYAQTESFIKYVCNFVNFYNVNAFKNGAAQFKLSTRINSETGYIDLVSAPDITSGATLHLYSPKLAGTTVAKKEVETTVTNVGGEEGTTGIFGAAFDAGSDLINASVKAEVAKAVELCLAKFPAGKRPDKFTLTSGASTEWGNPPKQMPKADGVGPVKPTDDASKNKDLAYRRGVSFMNALNAGLKAKGHPGFDNFEIAWSIGKSGQQANPADRFVSLEIQKNAVKPVAKETSAVTTKVTGGEAQVASQKGQLFELMLGFNTGK